MCVCVCVSMTSGGFEKIGTSETRTFKFSLCLLFENERTIELGKQTQLKSPRIFVTHES